MVRAAGIAFVCPAEGVILCVLRGPGADLAGTWSPPGGGIEPGETEREAALREASEELGVDPDWLQDSKPYGVVRASNGFVTFVDLVTKRWKRRLGILEPDGVECEDIAWLPLDRLPDALHPGFAEVLPQQIERTERQAAESEVDGRPTGPGVEYAPDRSYDTAKELAGPNPGIALRDLNPWDGWGPL